MNIHCAVYLTSNVFCIPLHVAGLLPPAVSTRYTVSIPPRLSPFVSLRYSHLIAPSALLPGHDDVGASVSASLPSTVSGKGEESWSRAKVGAAPVKKWWPTICS